MVSMRNSHNTGERPIMVWYTRTIRRATGRILHAETASWADAFKYIPRRPCTLRIVADWQGVHMICDTTSTPVSTEE